MTVYLQLHHCENLGREAQPQTIYPWFHEDRMTQMTDSHCIYSMHLEKKSKFINQSRQKMTISHILLSNLEPSLWYRNIMPPPPLLQTASVLLSSFFQGRDRGLLREAVHPGF